MIIKLNVAKSKNHYSDVKSGTITMRTLLRVGMHRIVLHSPAWQSRSRLKMHWGKARTKGGVMHSCKRGAKDTVSVAETRLEQRLHMHVLLRASLNENSLILDRYK